MHISAQSRQMNTLAPATTRPLALSFGIVLEQNEQVIPVIGARLFGRALRFWLRTSTMNDIGSPMSLARKTSSVAKAFSFS